MKGTFSFILLLHSGLLVAQGGPDVSRYLSRLEAGEVDEVRKETESLLERYPDDPGVQFLRGRVAADGAEAVRIYQGIGDDFPKSEWADDALHRVYQFYYAIGLYRTAELKLNQLKRDYPKSPYAASGSDVKSEQLAEERFEKNQTDTANHTISESSTVGSGETGEVATGVAVLQQGQFALQVGAYASRENAEAQKLFFEDLGYPVEVINRLKDSRSFFLVLIGNYMTYEDAKAKGAEIRRNQSIEAFVVSR